ncbi:MAG: type I restriction endonuclease subunit R [Magnetococcales bacterium]|nr:type I restriction endonuclease subunit R [Magnetococcales bacterium]NGZ28426.1 type I restriction endonuclease subunit R [Magnetococcales bacterium]
MTEQQLEQEFLGWLGEMGYAHLHGPEIAPEGGSPERKDYRQILLIDRLRSAIHRLNPSLPSTAKEDALKQVVNLGSPVLLAANRHFHQQLVGGVKVQYQKDGETRGDFVQLMDWNTPGNNEWLAVNQYSVKGARHTRRPDMVLFVNGLPLVVVELKNPADKDADIWQAFAQLQTYKEQIADLFQYNEILVIADGSEARLGSLTADRERFMQWRTIDGTTVDPLGQFNELETLVRGLLSPVYLLDYIRYFILFEDDGILVKKIAGYHQFHAVRTAIQQVVKASRPGRDKKEKGKGGVVWHTQGSGKSITMTCFAARVMQEAAMENPTIVVITDRNDLDGQLFGVFSLAQDLLREQPIQATSRQDLRLKLKNRASGGILFTTIQKFMPGEDEDTFPQLSQRHNIVVMADEAHRTQYGFSASLKGKPGREKFQVGFAQHLRDALPNATFVAFTGTPVSSEDKDTRAVFGDYIHIYDMQQAQRDGATVAIYFESRLAKLAIKPEEIPKIDAEVDELTEDEEENQQNKLKSRWAALEKVVGAEPRITSIANDLTAHFEERDKAQTGKAMVVAMSREICVHLYNAIIKLHPDWHDEDPEKGAIKIVMTGSASDKALLRPHIYTGQVKKRLEKRFKDPKDPLRMVIVRDMWLTGFDVPCLHTLYIDKPMKSLNLMQAIARVNRVFKDKQGGLVVDYIGIANELQLALKEYTNSQGRGRPAVDTVEALAILLEKLEIIHGMLHGYDYSDFLTTGLKRLAGAANHILGQKDGKRRFCDETLAMSKAFTLCCTLDEAKAVREEVAFLQAVRIILSKRELSQKKWTDEEKELAIRQIINSAVVSEQVVDIFHAVGLEKPNIGILDEQFLAEVQNLPERNLAVELLERLLNGEIKSRFSRNLVQEKKFSELLTNVIKRYQNRAIETAQVIEELIAMAKKFREAANREGELGLTEDEIRFYDALADNESAVRELGDETLKKIAQELTEKLRKNITVDWSSRESVRAKLRIMVRNILRKYKYPPDQQEAAIALVLQQAQALGEEWTSD